MEEFLADIRIKLAESATVPAGTGWCKERHCASFYIDFITRKPYPCPHEEGTDSDR